MTDQRRINPAFGELNPVEPKQTNEFYSPNVSTAVGALGTLVRSAYEQDAVSGLGFPLKGIVLRVNPETKRSNCSSWVANFNLLKDAPTLKSVVVRIPELHSAIPLPAVYGLFPGSHQQIIDLHPSFLSINKDVSNQPVAEGDVVYVDFGNRANLTDPIYLGPVYQKPNPGVVGIKPIPNQSLFNDPGELLFTPVAPVIPDEELITPSATIQEVAYSKGNDLGLVNLIELPVKYRAPGANKVLVVEEQYPNLIEMLDAAHAEGVNIKVSSAFRTNAEQEILYDLYKANKGNLAARPGYSEHQNGVAYDFYPATDSDSLEWEWLSSNAHRYGFWNAGREFSKQRENWHWEFVSVDSFIARREGNLSLAEKKRG